MGLSGAAAVTAETMSSVDSSASADDDRNGDKRLPSLAELLLPANDGSRSSSEEAEEDGAPMACSSLLLGKKAVVLFLDGAKSFVARASSSGPCGTGVSGGAFMVNDEIDDTRKCKKRFDWSRSVDE
jgi:hypothetical protein